MAEGIVCFVVDMIGNLLIEEGKFLVGVRDQVDQLHEELKRMRWFLKDAERRQDEVERLRFWISQTRDLAYQAEYLLERYAFKIQSRKGRGVKNIMKRCFYLLDECLIRHQVGSDIESLNAKISELSTSFHNYGIRSIMENEGGISSKQQLRRTHSHIVAEDLVGLDNQVEMLTRNLVSEDYALLSISGMGGLGKTTLARKVYHHPDVRRHFEVFSWICISQQWQTRDLLEGIITKFMPGKRELIKQWRDEELVRQLFEFQQNKKCLVVLDDIWSSDAWESIKDAFLIGEIGSKVILTTRNREVATHIHGVRVFLHQPHLLSKEECWELLQKKILVRSNVEDYEDFQRMEELGKDMVKYCGGLPLAVLVLGGILATKQKLIEWKNVHKNVKSYIGKGNNIGHQNQGEVQNILDLSYKDLPYQLKPCFLYLSKYLEDARIKPETLYQIWMAEGLLSKDHRVEKETMMDVADRYLEELAARCMVFVEMEEEMPTRNRFESCHLHDIMRELCLQKAKEEKFLELIDYRNRNGTEHIDIPILTSGSPRVAIYLGGEDGDSYVSPGGGLSQHLRAFTFTVHKLHEGRIERVMNFIIDDFKMLKVLSVEENRWSVVESLIIHFPAAIAKLIHLRYLRLWIPGSLVIPPSICKLKHLQTLDLHKCAPDTVIPKVIRELERLEHLHLPANSFHDPPADSGENVRLDGLHNLEMLHNLDNKRCDIKGISKLKNLRSLSAVIYEKLEDLEDFIKQISTLSYLRFLSLEINDCDFCSEEGSVLLKEVFSCSRLNELLILGGSIRNLPEYESCFLPNLHSLRLDIQMEEDPIKTLEKLPSLRRLSLWQNSFMGQEIICHATGFPQLKHLSLIGLENMISWQIEEGAMPNLCTLRIYDCKRLKMIPDGLRLVNNLRELEIISMPKEFRNRLQVKDGQEGEDLDKVRHVPSIIFRQR